MSDSPALAPDEKVCPFCAETIKRAAIRCRYCQSDLVPHEEQPVSSDEQPAPDEVPAAVAVEAPAPAVDSAVEPVDEPVDETVDETGDVVPAPAPVEAAAVAPAGRRSRLDGLGLMIALLVLCLVLAGVAAFAWSRDDDSEKSADGAITSSQARSSGLQAATTLTQKVLSYNWQTLDQDVKATEAVLAPSFRAEYAKTMAGVRDQTVKNQVKLTASAVATSIVSASAEKVVALVFVNQLTTAKGTGGQRLDQNRVLVTLSKDGQDWRVSKMDAF